MADICSYCDQEMLPSAGCDLAKFDDLPGERLRCTQKQCPGCLVARGQYHHPGCAVEDCHLCGQKAAGCACEGEEQAADETLRAPVTAAPELTEDTEGEERGEEESTPTPRGPSFPW